MFDGRDAQFHTSSQTSLVCQCFHQKNSSKFILLLIKAHLYQAGCGIYCIINDVVKNQPVTTPKSLIKPQPVT